MSFNTRRLIALVVVVLGAVFGALVAGTFTDSQLVAVAGAVLGAVVGLVFVVIWANQSL